MSKKMKQLVEESLGHLKDDSVLDVCSDVVRLSRCGCGEDCLNFRNKTP